MEKRKLKKVLQIGIPILIAAAMFVSIFCFMEVEIRGVICYVRHFYATPFEAMDKGGRLNWQLTEYGLDADTPLETVRIDETNALCLFLCHDVVVIEEMYTKDGGYRAVGTETICSYESVAENTELGSLNYVELWLLLPNGRYGRKCSYALRAGVTEPPAGAKVFPLEARGETWSLIVTDPK